MTKEMIIVRLKKVAEFGGCQGYHYTVKTNEWNNYGRSRTYLSIVETREGTKHYKEKRYGYFDNQSGEYVADSRNDLSGDYAYDFGGNHKIDFTEPKAEETKDEKYDKSNIMKNAWAIARNYAVKFGGKAKDYIAVALKISWAGAKGLATTDVYVKIA